MYNHQCPVKIRIEIFKSLYIFNLQTNKLRDDLNRFCWLAMNQGKSVFAQTEGFLPQGVFDRIADLHEGN